MTSLKQLHHYLAELSQFHPHYGNRLATHLPMVLTALYRLGANDSKLDATYNSGIEQLELADYSSNLEEITDIRHHLGKSQMYESYLAYFNTEIKKHGAKTVLGAALPILMPGVAASAFHALIRLAYAIGIDSESEMAIALAYWSAEYQAFGLRACEQDVSMPALLSELAPIGVNHNFGPGIIVDRMNEIGTLLTKHNLPCIPAKVEFNELRRLCLNAFAAQNDFTLLHTVTGCHALSVIMPFIYDKPAALCVFWQAILVAYLSTGLDFKLCDTRLGVAECQFEPILAKALESDDSHVIKLVYTCWREFVHHQEPLYYVVAKRAVSQ